MRLHRVAAPLLCLVLAQCGSPILPPYESVPPPLSEQAQRIAAAEGTSVRVAICYNAFTTTAERVRALAQESCGAGTVPRPVGRDFRLTNCPLLEPARATFACVKS